MRKLVLLLSFSLSAGLSHAGTPSKDMLIYLKGCETMLEGINNGYDKYLLSDAIDIYCQAGATVLDTDYYSVVCGNDDRLNPRLLFIPDFADKISAKGQLVNPDDISILRDVTDNIGLVHDALRCGGSVTYSMPMTGECEMMLVSVPGGNVDFTVKNPASGDVYESTPIEGKDARWCSWQLPEGQTAAEITVTNRGTENVTYVMAIR